MLKTRSHTPAGAIGAAGNHPTLGPDGLPVPCPDSLPRALARVRAVRAHNRKMRGGRLRTTRGQSPRPGPGVKT